jgi:sarcosine oxidase, subunit beta
MAARTNLPTRAEVVIVGGGIQGLSIAYNLARNGQRNVLVLDAGYFQGGASGRNGTLIRGGFFSEAWTALFSLANRRWIELSRELQHNVMFSRRGYLLVAEKDQSASHFDGALALHRRHDVNSRRVSMADLARLAPALKQDTVRDVIYFKDGGVAPHQAAMEAYLTACRRLGVGVVYATPVTQIERSSSRVCTVRGAQFEVGCDSLVIAAASGSNALARSVGAELPGFPMRIEAMVLEPTRLVLKPALALMDRLCYLSQTARGEIVGGAEVPESAHNSLASDVPAMAATARAYAEMLPCLSELRILRQWAGLLHVTPDCGPLIGRLPGLTNAWVSAGWCYGYACAPAVGELMASAILSGTLDARLTPFAVDRFARNRPVYEAGIVVATPDSSPTAA